MKDNNMNKIILDDELINLEITNDEEIFLEEESLKEKVINIRVKKNNDVIINEIKNKNSNNVYNYYLEENASLIVNKFYNTEIVNENNNAFLEGKKSKFDINISCISKNVHEYKFNIYHNNEETISNTKIHGITLKDEKILIENNGYIKNGSINSNLNQDNKIITMFKNNSIIKPNLYIDEFNSYASHGAYIGKFEEEKLFYLKSRGLNEKESNNLMIKGFLLSDLNIENKIKEKLTSEIIKELEVNYEL